MRAGWLALLLLAGCKPPPPVSMADVNRAPAERYEDVVLSWTRHGHVVHDFDESVTVQATLHGPEMRAAYAEKWVALYQLNRADAERTRAQLFAEVGDVWEVHLESSAHFSDEDNFKQDKKVWRLALLTDRGREVGPSSVRIDKTRREVQTTFYPYASDFTRGWKVQFPRLASDGQPLIDDAATQVILRIAGPHGSTDLVWSLKR
jgi:hypothetical protein